MDRLALGVVATGGGPDSPGGSSVARWIADVDTGDKAADFRVLGEPTPGVADFLVVPEPGTGVLLGAALLGLAGLRRGARRFRRHEQSHQEDAH